jgi:hypothetical protein
LDPFLGTRKSSTQQNTPPPPLYPSCFHISNLSQERTFERVKRTKSAFSYCSRKCATPNSSTHPIPVPKAFVFFAPNMLLPAHGILLRFFASFRANDLKSGTLEK